MQFERSERYLAVDEWEPVSMDFVLKVCTTEQIEMMVVYKAVVRVGNYKYRRHIPEKPIDWSDVLKGE